jgi:hypothetical protein
MNGWLAAFVFTQIVEVPIYLFAIARARARSFRPIDLAIAFGASAITHPILWMLFPRSLSPRDYVIVTAFAEALVVLVEAAWLRLFGVRRAIAWSLLANAASLGLGLISRALFGKP